MIKESKKNIGGINNSFAWIYGSVILVMVAVTESLPFILGTGQEAKWDWGFIYVTMRFGVLPIACIAHLSLMVFRIFKPKYKPLNSIQISSLVISVGYLIMLYLHPLPLTE